MNSPDSLTTREVSQRLNVTPARVHQLVRQGRLRSTKFAGAFVFDPAEVDKFAGLDRKPGAFRYKENHADTGS